MAPSSAAKDTSSSSSHRDWRWGETVLLLGIVAVALFLRLWHLGDQSLWIDEANAILQNSGTLAEMWSRARSNPLDLPLDRFFLHLVATTPPNEFLFRLPAALFGVLAVPLTYVFTRRLWGKGAGLLAAGLLALSPFHIRYSQEARNYSSFLVLHQLSLILLIRARDSLTWKRWLAYTAVATLALYDHLYGAFTLGLQVGLHWLSALPGWFSRKLRRSPLRIPLAVRWHSVAILLIALLFLPWVLNFALADTEPTDMFLKGVKTLRPPSDIEFDVDLLVRMLRWFVMNENSSSPMVLVIVLALALAAVMPHRKGRETAWWVLSYCGLNVLLVALGSRISDTYLAYRRLLYLLPLLLAVSAAGLVRTYVRIVRWLRGEHAALTDPRLRLGLPAAAIMAVGLVWWPATEAWYCSEKEDWRELSGILVREATPDDVIINYAMGYQSWRALEAYLGPDLGGLRILSPDAVWRDAALLEGDHTGRVVWQILPIPQDASDVNHRTLNDPAHLRVIDADRSLPPIELLLSLERRSLPGSGKGLQAMVEEGLRRTSLTETAILSSWRFNALNALTTVYDHSGRREQALREYEFLAESAALPAGIRANLASIVEYLRESLLATDGMIVGAGWSDDQFQEALVERLVRGGYVGQGGASEETLKTITRSLAELSGYDASRTGADGGLWTHTWVANLAGAVVNEITDGCPSNSRSCLLIVSEGPGFHGSIQQTIPVQGDALYLIACTVRTRSEAGLQGKALFVEYRDGVQSRGAYASAFWGSADWQRFVALFAAPAGVSEVTLSPVLIDNSGQVWVSEIQMIALPDNLSEGNQ